MGQREIVKRRKYPVFKSPVLNHSGCPRMEQGISQSHSCPCWADESWVWRIICRKSCESSTAGSKFRCLWFKVASPTYPAHHPLLGIKNNRRPRPKKSIHDGASTNWPLGSPQGASFPGPFHISLWFGFQRVWLKHCPPSCLTSRNSSWIEKHSSFYLRYQTCEYISFQLLPNKLPQTKCLKTFMYYLMVSWVRSPGKWSWAA